MQKHENSPNDGNQNEDEPKKTKISRIENVFSGFSSIFESIFRVLEKLIHSVSECVKLLIEYKPEEGASVLRWLITLSALVIMCVTAAVTVMVIYHKTNDIQLIEQHSNDR